MLRHPCILGYPQHRGTKSEEAASPRPSLGPKRGWKCYVTPTTSGIRNIEERNLKRLPHPCLLWGPKVGRYYVTPTFSGIPNIGDKNKKCLTHPCLFRGPKEGSIAMSPLYSEGSPTPSTGSKIKSGPQQMGKKSKVAASALPSLGPK